MKGCYTWALARENADSDARFRQSGPLPCLAMVICGYLKRSILAFLFVLNRQNLPDFLLIEVLLYYYYESFSLSVFLNAEWRRINPVQRVLVPPDNQTRNSK